LFQTSEKLHLKYMKSSKQPLVTSFFLIQTCGKFSAQVWVYRLFLLRSHRQGDGESSQNWQWKQNKCHFGNFWWFTPLIWNTSVNYKEWCEHAVDFYKFWALFAHWLEEATAKF
jgi:hypothetical protein